LFQEQGGSNAALFVWPRQTMPILGRNILKQEAPPEPAKIPD
jgi:hypothetical protein